MSLLYTPNGDAIDTERTKREIHLPLEFMRMLAIFARNADDIGIGLYCKEPSCKQALTGQNAREDNFWKMECACRKYIGRNPLPTAQKKH